MSYSVHKLVLSLVSRLYSSFRSSTIPHFAVVPYINTEYPIAVLCSTLQELQSYIMSRLLRTYVRTHSGGTGG